MNDSSRAQGGLICVGVLVVGVWFLVALLQQSYWALLAIPDKSRSPRALGAPLLEDPLEQVGGAALGIVQRPPIGRGVDALTDTLDQAANAAASSRGACQRL